MQHVADHNRRVQEAAYNLYVERGMGDGNDLSDWLEAEKMLKEQSAPAAVKVVPKRKTSVPKTGKKSGK